MLIRQHATAIDPLLLDVICPFLRATGLDRVFPFARLWNTIVVPAPERALEPVLVRCDDLADPGDVDRPEDLPSRLR